MNRRNALFAWLGTVFGYVACGPSFAGSTPKKEKGILCFYINVGQLPPYKAEAFMERYKEKFLKDGEVSKRFITFWIPTRTQPTRVEILPVGNLAEAQLVAGNLKGPDQIKGLPFTPPDKKETKDYILLMLVAPVVKIELDEGQIDLCYDMAANTFNAADFNSLTDGLLQEKFRQLVLARATIVLGMIRSRYKNPPGPEGVITLDGPELVETGKQDLDNVLEWIADHKVV